MLDITQLKITQQEHLYVVLCIFFTFFKYIMVKWKTNESLYRAI